MTNLSAQFEVIVKRKGDFGIISFRSGDVAVETICWWDPDVVVEENSSGYVAYATHMSNRPDTVTGRARPGIWLGKNVKYAKGTKKTNGIFIHEGKNAKWSNGCIVAARSEIIKIWEAIRPKELPNVRVKVFDEGTIS